jgi:hypothetical protein
MRAHIGVDVLEALAVLTCWFDGSEAQQVRKVVDVAAEDGEFSRRSAERRNDGLAIG